MSQPTKKADAKPAVALKLAPAGESGDPAVHRLLAEMATARSNGNTAEVEAVTKQLTDLGYE